jgi:hypothetical protein
MVAGKSFAKNWRHRAATPHQRSEAGLLALTNKATAKDLEVIDPE